VSGDEIVMNRWQLFGTLPLFTEVRGSGIPRSPYTGSWMQRA
jgi:hypothetical protein